MKHFVYQKDENTLITHDGEVQLGILHTTLEDFLSRVQVSYQVVHWVPDTFNQRYKRINFQKHLNQASINTKED
jgi:hypothetical protein